VAGVIDLPTKVTDFRKEAKGCLELAKALPNGELRTVVTGMAVGWLRLANFPTVSKASDVDYAEN
jgi:hypothetical protein